MYTVHVCVCVHMSKASHCAYDVHHAALEAGFDAAEKRLAQFEEHVIWSLALCLLLWPCAGFRVARNRCWNAVTVTEGPTHSPHCESKPKLHFIRLLSLQRLSHHSINTPVSPLQICFPSFFFTHENAQGPFQLSDVALYFVRCRKKPHNSGSF